jgi:hypothetical protein
MDANILMRSVIAKYLLSFRKTEWNVEDYPIRIRHYDVEAAPPTARIQPARCSAQVVNWPFMEGCGDNPEAALANLRERFAERRRRNLPFPRPGRGLPPEFAPTHRIAEHPDLARDFLARIFDLNYDECFISDGSSLGDFHMDDTNDELNEKVLLTYGVDVSDIESGNLADIFVRLVSRGVSV